MKKHNSQIFFIYIVLALTLFFPIVHPAYGQEITTEQLQEKGVLLFPLSENEWLMIIRLRELAESHWFLLSASDNQKLGVNISSMIEVADIVASPSGHYLAVISVGEGHPILEVVDAVKLKEQQEYHVIREINPYPGTMTIFKWEGETLIVESDVLLTAQKGADNTSTSGEELLTEPRQFYINISTGAIREYQNKSN